MLVTDPTSTDPTPSTSSCEQDESATKDRGVMCQPDILSTGTQTDANSALVKASLKTKILENELILKNNENPSEPPTPKPKNPIQPPTPKSKNPSKSQVPAFGIDSVKDSDSKCKFFTGLTFVQFMMLWECLGECTK